jgi:SpoIIAA-like
MAVIAGHRRVEWALKASTPFVSGEMKTFAPSQRGEAHGWIKS